MPRPMTPPHWIMEALQWVRTNLQRATVSGVSKRVSHTLCSPFSLNTFHLNALLKGQLTLNPAHTHTHTHTTLLYPQQMIRLTFRGFIFSSLHPSVFPFKRWILLTGR
jgi:hypothetical protein